MFTGRFFFPFIRGNETAANAFPRPWEIGVRIKGGAAAPAFQHDACIRPSLFLRRLRGGAKPGMPAVRAADGERGGILNHQNCRADERPGNVTGPERPFRIQQPDCRDDGNGAQGI